MRVLGCVLALSLLLVAQGLVRAESPGTAAAASALPAGKPNIVIILADDLGWADLGCYGSTFYETPALDKLASQGMRFTQAYAATTVCSPTRAALLTGKYPARVGVTNFLGGERKGKLLPATYLRALPAEEITLAEALREQGYRTACMGKWHLGGQGSGPGDHGFDVVGANTNPGRGPANDPHFATQLSTEAVKFIEQSKDQPFFLYLPLHSVHVPLKTRPELKQKYEAKAAKLAQGNGPREVPVQDFQARAVQDHAVYAGMMQEMDEAVARVLAKLEELKLAERTLVVFTSDNGGLSTAEGSPTSNLPLRGGKGWNYEGGLRVPWIVRWPGQIKAGSTEDTPVITCDLYPTMMAAAGLNMPAAQKADGVSLVPVLLGQGKLAERPLYWHYPHYSNQGGRPGAAVRVGHLKLIEFFENQSAELYDLSKDPGENRDLASSDPASTQKLQQMLRDWRESVQAKMPTANPDPVEPFGPRKKQ